MCFKKNVEVWTSRNAMKFNTLLNGRGGESAVQEQPEVCSVYTSKQAKTLKQLLYSIRILYWLEMPCQEFFTSVKGVTNINLHGFHKTDL